MEPGLESQVRAAAKGGQCGCESPGFCSALVCQKAPWGGRAPLLFATELRMKEGMESAEAGEAIGDVRQPSEERAWAKVGAEHCHF